MKKSCHYRCVCGIEGVRVYDDALADDDATCNCGVRVRPHITSYGDDPPPPQNDAPMCFAKGREFTFNKKMNIPNMGRRVRSDAEQHALYMKRCGDRAKLVREQRRSRSRKSDIQWEHVARVPLEMHESAIETQGDKMFWNSDVESKLKRMGMWFGS